MPRISFSIITPSCGNRPKALDLAIRSVQAARDHARNAGCACDIEMLVGFDGTSPRDFSAPDFVKVTRFPFQGNFGNPIRNALITIACGERVLFVDDDNALTSQALLAFSAIPDVELVVGRIDTSRAFDVPFLPRVQPCGREGIVQGNIDPLCLAVQTDFLRTTGRGWKNVGGYESDYLNILRYVRRADRVAFIDDVVGIYDAGRGLDPQGANSRQLKLKDAVPWSIDG